MFYNCERQVSLSIFIDFYFLFACFSRLITLLEGSISAKPCRFLRLSEPLLWITDSKADCISIDDRSIFLNLGLPRQPFTSYILDRRCPYH
ncbi:hypothetical protein BDW42DRAFT_81606 [Aspergillus taichungensis]|uniref:Uncharacterized protein n=1 Tax=Aspergillus taichungensis TaxID=482145 RepID=A0A2J5HXU9_9EURO|nr:hypothetical protein BDW42DRAFT_81606 [Aspergillus taichungensis]